MKKIILFVFATLMMVGCEQQETQTKQERVEYDYSVIIVDGCEYIVKTIDVATGFRSATQSGYLAHKGNCRFCTERRKQELEAFVKQIKNIERRVK